MLETDINKQRYIWGDLEYDKGDIEQPHHIGLLVLATTTRVIQCYNTYDIRKRHNPNLQYSKKKT